MFSFIYIASRVLLLDALFALFIRISAAVYFCILFTCYYLHSAYMYVAHL